MNVSETIGSMIAVIVITVILAAIAAALIHFITADNIWSVLVLYLAVASIPSAVSNTSVSKSSAIIGSLLSVVILFFILQFAFPMIFGPNIGFPYTMLDLGPVITGLIVSLIMGLICLLWRI